MGHLADRIRTRIAPALLTALGVTFLAAGVLSLTTTVAADPVPTPAATASPESVVSATPSPLITLPPLGSGGPPPPIASFPPGRVATRVRIAALKIDLPVISGSAGYPACNVAMYLTDLHQPGQGMATYIYAHARDGMFGPIWNLAIVQAKPQKLLGLVVEVYTSDDQRFIYEIKDVRLHQRTLDDVGASGGEELWLQTSEGPHGTKNKLFLVGSRISVENAASYYDAHPTPHIVICH